MRGMCRYLLVLLVACGGGSSKQPDAYVPDMLLDAPEPPVGTYRYVIATEKVPANNNEARNLALDLNSDGMPDNQLGLVIGTFAAMGLDSQTPTTTAIDRGTILQLVEVVAPDLTLGTATFALYTGANPMPSPCAGTSDTTCRHHLNGMASFEVSPATPGDTPLAGSIAAGTLTAGPGHVQVHLAVLTGKPIPVTLIGARVQVKNLAADKLPEIILGGGISNAERDATIYPAIRDNANEAIMRDCASAVPPDCVCAGASTGKQMLTMFDTSPMDCTISLDEIRNNSLMQSLFTADQFLESQPAISIGIGLSAVHAGFQP